MLPGRLEPVASVWFSPLLGATEWSLLTGSFDDGILPPEGYPIYKYSYSISNPVGRVLQLTLLD